LNIYLRIELNKSLQNRTIIFLGDSLSENIYFAITSFLPSYNIFTFNEIQTQGSYAHIVPSYNYSSRYVAAGHSHTLPIYEVLESLFHELNSSRDIIIVNTGLHWIPFDLHLQMKTFVDTYKLLRRKYKNGPQVWWKETTAQHFHTSDGQFEGLDSQHKTCIPSVKDDPENSIKYHQLKNSISIPYILDTDIPIMYTWKAESTMGNEHLFYLGKQHNHIDCTHWCVPSSISIYWVELLFYMMDNRSEISEQKTMHSDFIDSREYISEESIKN